MKKYFFYLVVLSFFACNKGNLNDEVSNTKEFLEFKTEEFKQVSEDLKQDLIDYQYDYDNPKLRSLIEKRVEKALKNNFLAENNFTSLLDVYFDLRSINDVARLKSEVNGFEDYFEYIEKYNFLELKIVPEEAAFINSNGIIGIDQKVIKLTNTYKKTIENGDESLIAELNNIFESTNQVTVEKFAKSKTTRKEVVYPLRIVSENGYKVYGNNILWLVITKSLFRRQYDYYVGAQLQTFKGFSSVDVKSSNHYSGFEHTGNDSYFLYNLRVGERITQYDNNLFQTKWVRIVATSHKKKLNITDELKVWSGFEVEFNDGYIFSGGFNNDKVDDGDIIFD